MGQYTFTFLFAVVLALFAFTHPHLSFPFPFCPRWRSMDATTPPSPHVVMNVMGARCLGQEEGLGGRTRARAADDGMNAAV